MNEQARDLFVPHCINSRSVHFIKIPEDMFSMKEVVAFLLILSWFVVTCHSVVI